jgi:hypothetical protein
MHVCTYWSTTVAALLQLMRVQATSALMCSAEPCLIEPSYKYIQKYNYRPHRIIHKEVELQPTSARRTLVLTFASSVGPGLVRGSRFSQRQLELSLSQQQLARASASCLPYRGALLLCASARHLALNKLLYSSVS